VSGLWQQDSVCLGYGNRTLCVWAMATGLCVSGLWQQDFACLGYGLCVCTERAPAKNALILNFGIAASCQLKSGRGRGFLCGSRQITSLHFAPCDYLCPCKIHTLCLRTYTTIHTYTHTYMFAHVFKHVHMFTHTRTHTQTHTHTRVHPCAQGHGASGVLCNCCNTVVSPSTFEAHAGHKQRRNPYDGILTQDGTSLRVLAVSGGKFVLLWTGSELCVAFSRKMVPPCVSWR